MTAPFHSFHAHVYFEPGRREQAAALRSEIASRFDVQIGRLHDRPVGPHPLPMFQVAFSVAQFAEFVVWLMQRRKGLPVLIHAETGDDLVDHTEHLFWLGEPLPLRTEIFR